MHTYTAALTCVQGMLLTLVILCGGIAGSYCLEQNSIQKHSRIKQPVLSNLQYKPCPQYVCSGIGCVVNVWCDGLQTVHLRDENVRLRDRVHLLEEELRRTTADRGPGG